MGLNVEVAQVDLWSDMVICPKCILFQFRAATWFGNSGVDAGHLMLLRGSVCVIVCVGTVPLWTRVEMISIEGVGEKTVIGR
jgi:hypothetical protein